MGFFGKKTPSGFTSSSTAEQVTAGIDGSGLTAIVTGASSGIGAETTRVLALRGVHVVMAVRNMAAGEKVKQSIVKEIPTAKVETMELDVSSLESVRKFASEFTSSGRGLNILINNAGIMATPFKLSKDNIEMQFATNHAGHFLLTSLLLETMEKTSSESKKEGRIVNVSSEGHRYPYKEGIRFDSLNDKNKYQALPAYAQSKLSNVLHANELTKRFKEEGVDMTANSLNPGVVTTNLFAHFGCLGTVAVVLAKPFMKIPAQGAATSCYVALNPQVKGVSGKYFENSNVGKPSDLAVDTDLAKKLWDFTIDLTKAKA